MKKLLLVGGIAISTLAGAQNIQEQDVTFKYTQLPSVPINDGTNQYMLTVSMNYLSRNDDSLKAFETRKEMWQTELNAALDIWEQDIVKADKQYYSSMMIYENQVALGNTAAVKPVKQPTPPIPFLKPRPKAPMVLTEINTAGINAGIKIEGLNMVPTADVKIELVYEGFEKGVPKLMQTGTAPNIKYYYMVSYRHPVTLKIDYPGKGLIVNERIPACEGFMSSKTPEYKTQAELEMYWMENEKVFWDDRQNKAPIETVNGINNYLNEKFGYPVKSRRCEIRTVKTNKDHDYSDFLTGYQAFQDGALMLQYKDKKKDALNNLQKAIDVWEKALTESDINDRKARIDKNVTSALYVNLMEAYLWMDDFSNAEIYGNKAIGMSNKYGRDAQDRMPLVRDMKMRYNANQ